MIGGAFLGGGVEVVPAGYCKLELEILTEDRKNLTATFTIKGTSTYTVTAGADGRAVYTVPAGQTYTVSVNTTGYDNIASQTVVAESGTVRYVRFEALEGRVKRSGDTMTGDLTVNGVFSSLKGDRGSLSQVGGAPTYGKWYRVASIPAIKEVYNDCHLMLGVWDNYNYNGYPVVRTGILNVHVRRANTTFTGNIRFSLAGSEIDNDAYALVTYSDYSAELYVQQTNSYGMPSFTRLNPTEDSNGWVIYNRTNTVSVDSLDDLGGTVTYANLPVIHPPLTTSDNSNAPATTSWINTADIICRTIGSQTIAGEKKFTAPITIEMSGKKTPFILNNTTDLSTTNDTFDDFAIKQKGTTRLYARYNATSSAHNLEFKVNDTSGTAIGTPLKFGWNATKGAYAEAITTPSNATGQEIATADWSLDKFVQKTGDTMTGNLTLSMGYPVIFVKNTNTPNKSAPTETKYGGYVFRDSGDAERGGVQVCATPTGGAILMTARTSDASSVAYLRLYAKDDGTKYADAPTPSDKADNYDKIATTKWVNSASSVVHTTGNETISGAKTFTSNPVIKNANPFIRIVQTSDDTKDTSGGITIGNNPDKVDSGRASFTMYHSASSGATLARMRALSDDGKVQATLDVRVNADNSTYATAPTTPSNASSNEIATADWVLSKVQGRSRLHEFNTFAELKSLIASGKRGDSFSLTLDYVGDSIIEDYEAENAEIHAFGNYSINTLELNSGALFRLEAFGSGEVRFNSKTFASTGYGMMSVLDKDVWAIRVPYGSYLNYFYITENEITSCTGYYIEL